MSDQPVERFKPTSGRFLGSVGLAVVAFVIGYVALESRTLNGLRTVLAMLLVATVIWVTQMRPRATAYADTLVLHNMLRDTFVPLRLIDEASVRQTLNVWVGDRRYTCVGIGRSVRSLVGHRTPSARIFGFDKLNDASAHAGEIPHPEHTAMPYATFVEIRVDDLANYARKERPKDPDARVRRSWAWPEIAALVLTSAGLVATLFP